MTTTNPPSRTNRLTRWPWIALKSVFKFLLVLWATLAIYYSNLPWPAARLTLAIAFAAYGVFALWLSRRSPLRWTFAGLFLGVVCWFVSIEPSDHRDWRDEVAVPPRAIIDGERVKLVNFRNFDYTNRREFTVRYEEREVQLSHLTSFDLYLSYWSVGPVGHTFVSFNFDNAEPVCISIETRPEKGEGFAPIASMFKQFELIYVVGSEQDLVGSRVRHRNEEVFLYPIRSSPEMARQLFLVYLQRVNELAERPEWYHLLSNSCTVNIIRYANMAGRDGRFDYRHLLNGWVDRYLYSAGVVDTSLPFEELRERSHINKVVDEAYGSPDFSRRIRAGLPNGMQSETRP